MSSVEVPVLAPCLFCLYHSGETNEALNTPEHGNTSKGICIMVIISSSSGVLLMWQAQTSFGLHLLWTSYCQSSCSKMSWADLCCVLQSSHCSTSSPWLGGSLLESTASLLIYIMPTLLQLTVGSLRISCTTEKAAYLSSHTNILWSLCNQHNAFYKILGEQILS